MNFSDTNSVFLLLAIAAPLLTGIVMLFGGQMSEFTRRSVAALGFGYPLINALLLFYVFDPEVYGYNFESRISTGLESVGIYLHLGLNGISMPLFLLAGIVGFAAGMYAIQSKAERPHLYLGLLLVMQGGLMGTFASVDIFFFYFFHEFALIPTFIMIGIWGGDGRRRTAIELTLYLTLGAMLSLIGLIGLYVESGAETFSIISLREYLATQPLAESLQRNIFALLLFGFGILVSLFPFHSWAPRGYAAAPTATAMLHAGVLKKFGLYGLIQIAAPLLPAGGMSWQPWLVWLALGNLLVIGFVTMAQRDLKQMIGYSSVMHMGYCFLGIAAFSVVGAGGTVLLMVAHGLSVALLFMLSTCIYHRTQTFDMAAMGGLATKAPVLCAFFVAATMAGIGLPGFANFWGELTIYAGLAGSPNLSWVVFPAAVGIVISAIYGLRAVANIFFGPPKERFAERLESGSIKDLQLSEKIPAVLLLTALVVFGIFPRFLSDNADIELSRIYPEEGPETVITAVAPVSNGIEE